MGDFSFRLKRVDATDPAVWARIVGMDAKCFVKGEAPALSDNTGSWWIAYSGDQEAGYCGIKQFVTGEGYLCRSGVLPKFRGCGLQKVLIRRRIAYARGLEWKVVVSDTSCNSPSGNSLIACGFRLYDPEKKWALESSLYWRKFLTGSVK